MCVETQLQQYCYTDSTFETFPPFYLKDFQEKDCERIIKMTQPLKVKNTFLVFKYMLCFLKAGQVNTKGSFENQK